MTHKLLVAFVLAFLGYATVRAGDAKKDEESFQGTWEVVEFVVDGKPIPEEVRKEIRVKFAGNGMTLTGRGEEKREFNFNLDPAKKPKGIDVIPQDGPFKDKVAPGIYQFDSGMLKLCIPNRDDIGRPSEFAAPENSKLGLFVLKRLKS